MAEAEEGADDLAKEETDEERRVVGGGRRAGAAGVAGVAGTRDSGVALIGRRVEVYWDGEMQVNF